MGFDFFFADFFSSWGRIIESCIETTGLHVSSNSPTNHLRTSMWPTHKPSLLHDLDKTRDFSLTKIMN
jgi:hypothetical protein